MALLKENLRKELWNHFTAKEAKAIAACVYGTWIKLPGPIQKEKITQVTRPWTIYELFMMAVEKFQKVIDESPSGDRDFLIANFDLATRVIDSGSVELDPREIAATKEVFEALFGVGLRGEDWGDEKKLQSYVDGIGGKLCKMYFDDPAKPENNGPFKRAVLKITRTDIEGFGPQVQRERGSMNDITEEETIDAPTSNNTGEPPKRKYTRRATA